jgi:hypothetical protein
VFAQIYDSEDGLCFVKALLVGPNTVRKIQKATGVEPGKRTKPGQEHSVWVAE